MAKMKWYDYVAFGLLSIGGFNWGTTHFWNFNIVEKIANMFPVTIIPWVGHVVYGAVFVSAVYSGYALYKLLK